MINVIVVDDHELVREGIKRMLSEAPNIKVVGEAANGEEAVKVARLVKPHVVLMDVKMPGVGGMEATQKLLHLDPDLKILIVTSCDNELFPARLLEAGAAGYITKDAKPEEMIQAIRSVYVGQRYFSNKIANILALKQVSSKGSPFDALSQREAQIMLMIMRGMKPKEIAEKLYLSGKTVNSYRYRIFEKLGVKNDVDLALLAIRYGIINIEETMIGG